MRPSAGRIKDPVHGYVAFTRLEREFLDDPLTQRLRWVGQSGLAHYVFPEVRTSRFAHSLGAMHLSSRFLASALRNTDAGMRAAVEVSLKDAMIDATQGFLPQDLGTVAAGLAADGLLGAGAVSHTAAPYVLLAEQGLRLAALFHDLGHLPFSHDFEYAIGRLFDEFPDVAAERFSALYAGPEEESGPAIHERIGYQLAGALFHKLHEAVFQGTELETLARCAVLIAEKILITNPPDDPALAVTPKNALDQSSVWWLLHAVMAGELDVDRCDYLLRDARAYGFEFASYDLDRLVDNLVVVRPRTDRGLLELGIRAQGVAAAESFLIARYRAYQWGPFHHKVAQLGAALQHCIRETLRAAIQNRAYEIELNGFLDVLQVLAGGDRHRLHLDASDSLNAFIDYDDIWWMTVLRARLAAAPDDPWLALVCRRRPGPRSLWKRPDQFPDDLRDFNAILPPRKDAARTAAWNQAVDGLLPGVLVTRHHFRPWKARRGIDPPASALLVLSGDGGTMSLTELSHITNSLGEAWANDVQVHAFVSAQRDPATITQHLREALT